jgi:hypothetical protein
MRTKNLAAVLLLCFFAAGVGRGEGLTGNANPAPDSQLRVNGKWTIQPRNSSGNTYRGTWVITQRGSELSGTAEWENRMQGLIQGTLAGTELDLSISHPEDLQGFYQGTLVPGCVHTAKRTTTANRGNHPGSWRAELAEGQTRRRRAVPPLTGALLALRIEL